MCVKLWVWNQIFFQNKLDIIPALTDANLALRHEKEKLDKDLDQVREQLKELAPLREKLKEVEEKEEKSQNLIKALRQEGLLWKQRASQLTELNKKLSPEELKRLETDNARLNKLVVQIQNSFKQQTAQVTLHYWYFVSIMLRWSLLAYCYLFWNFSVFASNFFKQFKMWNAWFILKIVRFERYNNSFLLQDTQPDEQDQH